MKFSFISAYQSLYDDDMIDIEQFAYIEGGQDIGHSLTCRIKQELDRDECDYYESHGTTSVTPAVLYHVLCNIYLGRGYKKRSVFGVVMREDTPDGIIDFMIDYKTYLEACE